MVTLLGALGIVYVVFYCLFSTDVVQKRQYDLEKDGVCLFPQVLSSKQIEVLKRLVLKGITRMRKSN